MDQQLSSNTTENQKQHYLKVFEFSFFKLTAFEAELHCEILCKEQNVPFYFVWTNVALSVISLGN